MSSWRKLREIICLNLKKKISKLESLASKLSENNCFIGFEDKTMILEIYTF